MNETITEAAIRRYQTPFYLFDTTQAAAQVTALKAAFPRARICYAMKANSFLVGHLQSVTDYFEVCSPGELQICRRAAILPQKLILSGVYKAPAEISEALDLCGDKLTCTVESKSQWELLSQASRARGLSVQVLLRLTPGNQFGLDRTEIEQLVAQRSEGPLHICGLQFFSGTQKRSLTRMAAELQKLDEFLSFLHQKYGFEAHRLEYGPGFPVNYFEGENFDENTYIRELARQLDQLHFSGEIVLELGRRIAAGCGSYCTRVVDVKQNEGKLFCIVNGGIHQLNYYGQLMAMKRPPVTLWPPRSGRKQEWTVCGSLCTANDVLLKNYPFTDLKQGDFLIFDKVGAYSATESMSLFLSRALPQVVEYSEPGSFRLVRPSLPTYPFNSEI